MSTIEELYYGNISPSDRFVKKGSKYQKLSKEILAFEDKLLKTIDHKEKAIFEQILESRGVQECIIEKDSFIRGFRLVGQLVIEILTEYKSQFE